MIDLRRPSPFIDLAAVEAWDAWFRWRDSSGLHDVSIEDTWRRVAAELISMEATTERAALRSRLLEALSSWQLLPDERILASAGTGRIAWQIGALHASLNAAAFVSWGMDADATIDLAALGDCAELAVRVLDNAALLARISAPHLRIGLIGVADALLLLKLGYDSDEGRTLAGALARALAEGCFRASVSLACSRGIHDGDASAAIEHAARRGLPGDLLHEARHQGLRHLHTTAITSQRRLALLANDVTDAIDPLQGDGHACLIDVPEGRRTMHSAGYALNMLCSRSGPKAGERHVPVHPPPGARSAMRAVVQPWVDEPIT